MYKAIATGKNENYGKRGERIRFADQFYTYVIKKDIARNIKKDGSGILVIRSAKTNKVIYPKR